jgi:hypothetical protein
MIVTLIGKPIMTKSLEDQLRETIEKIARFAPTARPSSNRPKIGRRRGI